MVVSDQAYRACPVTQGHAAAAARPHLLPRQGVPALTVHYYLLPAA